METAAANFANYATTVERKTPTALQIKSVVYLTTLTLIGPMVVVLLLPVLLYSALLSLYLKFTKSNIDGSLENAKTVLVTGAPHTKGLEMCRILRSAGHKVILADMERFSWSASRFSNCVHKWITLPNISKDDRESYKEALRRVIEEENVDWWIPTSHTATAVLDTEVQVHMLINKHKVKVLTPNDVSTAALLDDKILFMKEARAIGLPVTEFYEIESCNDVINLALKGVFKKKHFFLKPLNPYSEDRVCFSRIPDNMPELVAFLDSYKHKISPSSPYFVSEFVKGEEYTGTVIARNGEIYLFTSNPSSPMQIDYIDAGHKTQIYDWVKRFVAAKNLSGSLCFDFMEHPVTGKMMAIECNPRLHSNIVLMETKREEAAQAIYRALEGHEQHSFELNKNNNNNINIENGDLVSLRRRKTEPVVPASNNPHVYWLYNELSKLATAEGLAALKRIAYGKEAVWDITDPLPFLLLPHLQIPSLLWEKVKSGDRWEIVNFCLGQMR